MFINYYEVLGVSQSVTTDQIHSAYRERAKVVHPDVSRSPDADAEMKDLNAAYETLQDPGRRAEYDRQLEEEAKAAEERRRRNSPEVYIDYIGEELGERLGNMFGYRVSRRTGFHTYLAEIRTNFHTSDGRPINVMVSLNTENQRLQMAETETIPKVIGSLQRDSATKTTKIDQLELGYRQIFRDARQKYGVWTDGLKLRLDCDSLEEVPEGLFSMVQAVQYISSKADFAEREAKSIEESLRSAMPEMLEELFSYQLDEDGHLEVTTGGRMPDGQMIRLWWTPATDDATLPRLTDWGKTFEAVAKYNEECISDRDRLYWEEANEIYGTVTESLSDKEETLAIVKEVPAGNIADCVLSMMQAIGYIASCAMGTRDPQYFIDRGESSRKAGRTEEAVSDFDRAIALDPRNATAHCYRASTHMTWLPPGKTTEQQLEKALEDLDAAIGIDVGYEWAYRLRATANELIDRNQEAIDDWNQAIKLLPGYARAYCRRGGLYVKEDRLEEALRDLDVSLSLDNAHHPSYQLRARVRELQGNHKGAIADMSEAIRIAPTAAHYARRGSLYSADEQYEQAMADYESAWKKVPSWEYYREQMERNRELLDKQNQATPDQGRETDGDQTCHRWRSRLEVLEGR